MSNYIEGLNPEQAEAVKTTEGPLLVLAGAGTGKTKVLTSRLAYILDHRLCRPWEILAVTFTNKAAREMRDRIAGIVGGEAADQIWLGTFHAISARILRRNAEALGFSSQFTILDADDQLRLLKQIIQDFKIEDKKFPPQAIMALIQRWKDKGLRPDKISKSEDQEINGQSLLKIYEAYQLRLRNINSMDFGDLLLYCLDLFLNNPEIFAEYKRRFRYILVDEYQDTNVCQYLWLRLLAQGAGNICCVGDDDQSIYSWRGAEIANILRFEQDFPNAKMVRLERNYRSTPRILAVASKLIAHNRGRLGKTLRSGIEGIGPGEAVILRKAWDGGDEARLISEQLKALQRRGESPDKMAVLVRVSAQTREIEERLMLSQIPYQVIGGLRFYERLEIRDALAYLRLLAQPFHDLAFERIYNTPKRGLGDAFMGKLKDFAKKEGRSLLEALPKAIEAKLFSGKTLKTAQNLADNFKKWQKLALELPPAELCREVLEEAGYFELWRQDKSLEALGRLENLGELGEALRQFSTLTAFLEHVSLVMDNDNDKTGAKLSIMTIHAAKGLEFDTVFLPGWEEGIFPHQRALSEEGEKGLEEERRLAYVAITRARKRLIISRSERRQLYNQWQRQIPSQFLKEIEGMVDIR